MALGNPNHAVAVERATALESMSHAELRRHFARELHDEVSQPLIDLLLQLREARGAGEGQATSAIGTAEDAVRQVLRQAREMMIDLRGRSELKIGLATALKTEVPVPVGRTLKVNVTARWPKQTSGWAGFNLLRIVQQAAANAWHHGRARTVEVLLDVEAGREVVLLVAADGLSIEEAAYGFGIDGMRERAAILDGTFSVRPRPEGGTVVEVRVPLGNLA